VSISSVITFSFKDLRAIEIIAIVPSPVRHRYLHIFLWCLKM